MSNLTVPNFLANSRSRGLASALQQGSSFKAIPYISLNNSRFTPILPDKTKGKPMLEIEAIIVDAYPEAPKNSKQYYEGGYTGEENKGPTCFSYDGMRPHRDSEKPQNSVCATCPMNEWNSKINSRTGQGGKACQDRKRLAIIIPDISLESVFLLNVPPGSLKPLSEYAKELSQNVIGNRRIETSDVITRISFGDFKNLIFKPVGFIDENIYNAIQELDREDKKDITGIVVGRIEDPSNRIETPPAKSLSYFSKPSSSNYTELYIDPKKEEVTSTYTEHFPEEIEENKSGIVPVQKISKSIEDELRQAFNMQVG